MTKSLFRGKSLRRNGSPGAILFAGRLAPPPELDSCSALDCGSQRLRRTKGRITSARPWRGLSLTSRPHRGDTSSSPAHPTAARHQLSLISPTPDLIRLPSPTLRE